MYFRKYFIGDFKKIFAKTQQSCGIFAKIKIKFLIKPNMPSNFLNQCAHSEPMPRQCIVSNSTKNEICCLIHKIYKTLIINDLNKLFFIGFFLLISNLTSFAQRNEGADYDPNFKYEVQQLQSDFMIMRWVLEKAHPGLYWFTPKAKLEKRMDSTFNLLNRPMTEAEFYQILAPLIADIHCGHTILDPSYFYQNQGKRFPLDLFFDQNKAFIRYNYTENPAIVLGSEVLTINGLAINEIIKKMLPALAADAWSEQGKWESLNSDFQNYYDLLIAQPDSFVLECIDFQTKQPVKYQISAQDSDFLRAYDKRYYQELESQKALDFQIIDSAQAAILTINSFLPVDIKFSKQKFSKYIKKVFQTLNSQNIPDLIIDVRGNSGGEMLYANELFSYLREKPYRFLDRVQVTSDKKLSQLQFTDLSKTTIHNPRRVQFTDSGYVVKPNYYKFLEPQKPKKNPYLGNVYVLTGKRTFSAASLFAALVYAHRRGKIVGEETSGGASGLNGGDFVDLALPNTSLVLEVPIERWIKNIPAYPHKNRGVVPHHEVKNSIEDELKGYDQVLKFTLELIEKNRSTKPK
jgi:C-terminal processing protease CtpA/Prc